MSAMNPPCNAELTFMRLLPMRLQGMTEAALKLSESMDRLSAALERHNEQEQAVELDLNPMPTVHDIRQTQLEAANG